MSGILNEWEINLKYLTSIFQVWGFPEVDLFAMAHSRKALNFCSWRAWVKIHWGLHSNCIGIWCSPVNSHFSLYWIGTREDGVERNQHYFSFCPRQVWFTKSQQVQGTLCSLLSGEGLPFSEPPCLLGGAQATPHSLEDMRLSTALSYKGPHPF